MVLLHRGTFHFIELNRGCKPGSTRTTPGPASHVGSCCSNAVIRFPAGRDPTGSWGRIIYCHIICLYLPLAHSKLTVARVKVVRSTIHVSSIF